jgi:hypothetical protein
MHPIEHHYNIAETVMILFSAAAQNQHWRELT